MSESGSDAAERKRLQERAEHQAVMRAAVAASKADNKADRLARAEEGSGANALTFIVVIVALVVTLAAALKFG